MNPLRSLRNRLAVVFGLIVLAPSPPSTCRVSAAEDRLIKQKLDGFAADADERPAAHDALSSRHRGATSRRAASRRRRAHQHEILVLRRSREPARPQLAGDSTLQRRRRFQEVSRPGLEALRPPAREGSTPLVGRQAIAAEPLVRDEQILGVAVFADALADVEANVSLIRRQILVSGGPPW